MPRADFYLISKPRFLEKPLLLACELARKASDSGQPLLVLAASAEQAGILDELLWEFDEDAYVPHQVAGTDEEDELAPVLIVPPGVEAPPRPLVLNLRPGAVQGDFERVLEVVPADKSARDPVRERWKQYQARGIELKKIDM